MPKALPTDYVTRAELAIELEKFGDALFERIIEEVAEVFHEYVEAMSARSDRLEQTVAKTLPRVTDVEEVNNIQDAMLNRLEMKTI